MRIPECQLTLAHLRALDRLLHARIQKLRNDPRKTCLNYAFPFFASFAAKTTHFLDRIYRIDRIKSVGIAINSVFVLVLKRSRAEIDQESIIYSSRIEIVY